MATSVAQGFNELRDRFPLTKIQSELDNTKVANIKDFFNEKFFMAESAITIGSYARGSIIRVKRDVDILTPPTIRNTRRFTMTTSRPFFTWCVMS